MHNRGLIKLFAFLFGLVSIYQLSFTFITNKVETSAEEYAKSILPDSNDPDVGVKQDELVVKYLDSVAELKQYGFTTYENAKKKQLNKGLDLEGGINATIQISIKDILIGLSDQSKNPVFTKALADADELAKNSDDTYIDLFFEAFDNIKGDTRLASPEIFFTKNLGDDIKDVNASDDIVRPIIRQKIDDAIVSAFEVLRERIDGYGVTQPNIQRIGTSGRVLIELPGAKDVKRALELVSQTAELQFWETYPQNTPSLSTFLVQANEKLKTLVDVPEKTEEPVKEVSELDSLLSDVTADSLEVANQVNPLLDKFIPPIPGTNAWFRVAVKDQQEVDEYLRMPEIRRLLPADIQFAKFAWKRQSAEKSDVIELFALKSGRDNKPRMSGDVVSDARSDIDLRNRNIVRMSMNSKGAKEWQKLTSDANKNNTGIAVVLDDKVYTAPGCSVVGGITGGGTEISGNFKLVETKDIANVLRAGKLPAKAEIIQSEIVGPSLGQEAIDSGLMSFIIAMIIVLVWMVFYYGKAGIFADVALLLNILLIFGTLTSIEAVLTLPGIAGIVLTIGMSVDANVLIFERIKEEIKKGKGKSLAVADGFNNALSSILDANITTGLTALILLVFGSGPIKGFATTLLIGILTSLFTAIFVTRLLVDWYLSGKNRSLDFSTALTKNLFQNINIKFLGKRKIAYIISAVLVGIGLFSLLTQGLQQGVDFIGGRSYTVRFEKAVNTAEITSKLDAPAVFDGGTKVKTFGEANQIKITTPYKVDVEGIEVDDEIQGKLFTALQNYLPDGLTQENFVIGSDDKVVGIMQSVKVGPTIADDIKQNAYWAIIGSLAVVFLYILLRFRKWQYSLGAVTAVFHDVMIVLGIFSIFGATNILPFSLEIDQAFIAAILTVIGYSLNDTVVVFDRIREIIGEKGWKGGSNVNLALNSTLSRTLNTSLTTLVVLLAIFVFGGESLRGFMFAMIVGIIVGTYSSLFIATPVMFDSLKKAVKGEKQE